MAQRATATCARTLRYPPSCIPTRLQAQLQKAARFAERTTNGDINPKDFILFHKEQYELQWARKDNTGKGEYIEGMSFPTLDFPSDHGLISMRATLTTG